MKACVSVGNVEVEKKKQNYIYVAATDRISGNNIEQCERNEWRKVRESRRERKRERGKDGDGEIKLKKTFKTA